MNIKRYELKANLQSMPYNYPISAKIVKDSIDSNRGIRLTTLELEFPRYVLAEFNTHRALSRNSSSSRAIPVNKQITHLAAKVVEPVRWGKNKSGMQAAFENLTGDELQEAREIWWKMAEVCMDGCNRLSELGLHKQWANRPLEWFSTSKVLVSATDWDNFFLLRDHSDAQDEIAHLAQQVKTAMNGSTPRLLNPGRWHLPYVSETEEKELGLNNALRVSAARSARLSYKTVHGVTSTLEEDVKMFDRLTYGMNFDDEENPFHASPTEHQATPIEILEFEEEEDIPKGGNFLGWTQCRQYIEQGLFNKII